jgi:DNA-binding transcriptional MerR regulator
MAAGGRRDQPKYVMISVVAERYSIHPQTLRLYEREGLLKPARSSGNTRLYDEEAVRRLEIILALTRDLGVNLAGVEVILNMKERMEQMQGGSHSSRAGHLVNGDRKSVYGLRHQTVRDGEKVSSFKFDP